MKHWSIGKQLLVGFGSVVAMALGVGAIALWSASALNGRVDQLAGVSGQALQQAAEVRFLVADLKARERLVVVATAKQDTAVMALETQTIKEEYATLTAAIAALVTASHADAPVTAKATGIADAMRAWADQWAKTEEFAKKLSALDAAESTDAGRRYSDQAADLAKTIQQGETEQFARDRAAAASIYTWVRGLIALSLLVGGALAAAVGYAIKHINATLRRATTQLRTGSEHVLQAAGQVASSAQTLSRGVLQEAASLEETSASMEEISSMTRQNAEHSLDAARLVAEAETAVTNANEVLGEMVTSMANIKESSRKVSNIIKTIDEIAFQTNILALNAAVEAARAGAAGMGFAVVADEVRNLAQRSAHAAKDTAALIEESIARSDRGALRVEKVSLSMQEITNSVVKVKSLIDHVSEASRQQAHGFEQVSQALGQMEQMTQTNASSAEASATAGEALNTQARLSLATVEQLEALVGHADAAGLPAPVADLAPADRVSLRRAA
jgi:methyl-accepting chemotaxis protein/methyl-accepting chemotaxis protein-1 (serine sensor receptor)